MEKLFIFHGVDHKVGTTMVAQSTAEFLAKNYDDLKILFMTLNGRESAEYVRETPESIESIKLNLDNRILNSSDFMKACKKTESLYMLAGVLNETEQRHYQPDSVTYLLSEVAPEFHMIIVDSGSEIDNGLAVGSLLSSENRFLILTQQESAIRRWERQHDLYDKLNIQFPYLVLNKFEEHDPYGIDYVSKRLEIPQTQILTVEAAGYGKRAEMDYKTLMEYRSGKYAQDIENIANLLLTTAGIPIRTKQRKNKWKSFI